MKKHITVHYSAIQGLYWVTYGLMFTYASMFLLDRGYTNGAIGLILGLSYGLSALMQPLLAALFTRLRLRLSAGIAGVYCAISLLALGVRLLGGASVGLSCAFVALLTLQSALQPSVNSLQRDFELAGTPINFGLARGIGSAAYSVMCFVMGQLMKTAPTTLIPTLYFITSLLLILLLTLFRSPTHEAGPRQGGGTSLFREKPMFCLFCLGLVLLSATHIFIDNFYLQIFRSIGGDSGSHGIAIALSGALELPAMALYLRVRRRTGSCALLLLTGWAWLVKDALTFMAGSVGLVYVASVLQIAGYALYVPATVDFASQIFPDRFLGAQALMGSSFTVGSLLATLIGGTLIDGIGIHAALGLMLIPALGGAVIWTFTVPRLAGKK